MSAGTEEASSHARPRWGMPDVVVAFVVAQLASVVGFALFALAEDVPPDELGRDVLTIGEIALLQVPLWLGLFVVPVVATRVRGNGPRRDLGLWSTVRDAPVGVGIGVVCQLVLVPVVSLPVLLFSDRDREALEAPARELTDKAQGPGVVVLALVVVVAAPLAEEVFFRGLLQRTLLRHLPVWPSLLITALVFGVSHFQFLQLPALAAFGVVLSVLAHRTGRLGRNLWAHVGFNATTIVALVLGG